MIYSAVGLAVIGVVIGFAFRWKVLLPIIVLLPLAVIVFSVSRGLNHQDTAIAVVAAEALLQAGYFSGLVIRFISTASMRSAGFSNLFKRRRETEPRIGDDRHSAPPAGAGQGP